MKITNLNDYCTILKKYVEAIQRSPGAKLQPNFVEKIKEVLSKDYPNHGAFYIAINEIMGEITRTVYENATGDEFPNWIGGVGPNIDNKEDFITALKAVWPDFFAK